MFSLVTNFQDTSCFNKGFENKIVGVNGQGGGLYDDSVAPNYEPCTDNIHKYNTPKSGEENTIQFSPDFSALNDIFLDINSLPISQCKENATVNLCEPNTEDTIVVPLASLTIARNNPLRIRGLYGADFVPQPPRRFSTDDILRLAGENFIQTSSHQLGMALPIVSLSQVEVHDVALVQKLLFAADKCSRKQYDIARSFLDLCGSSSSINGNQMKRIVYYFSKSLREKIDRETGWVFCEDSLKKQAIQVEESLMKARPVILAFYQELPFYQISLYAGVQAITERVTHARRVHVIDLDIRSGLHTSVLIQALADRVKFPIQLLKITAVTTRLKSTVEETGRRLRDFAKSICLPFVFKIVMVPDIQDLTKELFEIDPEETVAVTALYSLGTMISRQNGLQYLMRVIKSINPRVMVVTESESKLNSPVFENRFIEALFFYGAFFDCVEDITSRNSQLRIELESIYLGYGIRNVIVGEGDERTIRHVSLDTWRKFFSRFDMKEEDLSPSLLLQANLVAKTYECCNSCTIYKNKKSLIVGWKGMPLTHVSAWTFENNDYYR